VNPEHLLFTTASTLEFICRGGAVRSAKNEILSFVKALVDHPESVQVSQSNGYPPVFEIRVHKEDLADIRSKEIAIKVICSEPDCRFEFVED
jgi:hypothetical protein